MAKISVSMEYLLKDCPFLDFLERIDRVSKLASPGFEFWRGKDRDIPAIAEKARMHNLEEGTFIGPTGSLVKRGERKQVLESLRRRGFISLLALIAFLGVTLLSRMALTEDRPSALGRYVCQHTVSKIDIDGRLDELSWQWATKVGPFIAIEPDSSVRFQTQAMLVWDKRNLYVAFSGVDPDVWATKTRRDDPVFEEESAEVFIGPYGDEGRFIEFGVNPLNTVYDLLQSRAYSLEGKANWSWNIEGLQTAVSVDGTMNDRGDQDVGWAVEIAVPWEALNELWTGISVPPKDGDEWRLKLLRIDRTLYGRIEITGWCNSSSIGEYGFLKFSKTKVGVSRGAQ